jgi:hypothetical protein
MTPIINVVTKQWVLVKAAEERHDAPVGVLPV